MWKEKKTRSPKGVMYYTDEEGVRQILPPTMSCWYNYYIEHPDLDNPRFHKKFRRRFRMPYNEYRQLLLIAEAEPILARWKPGNTDALGNPVTPISLLLLCALRYLGRGWTFDNLSENTAISEEVI